VARAKGHAGSNRVPPTTRLTGYPGYPLPGESPLARSKAGNRFC
jgi:hypothetical protein